MPYDTRSLPGTLRKEQGGEAIASGWCLLAFDVVGQGQPLTEWRGEMSVENKDEFAAASKAGGQLYLECKPYGGISEPWHGPVTVEALPAEHDPNGRRLRLQAAGPLTRSAHSAAGAPEREASEATV
jgi:hypothetical protein